MINIIIKYHNKLITVEMILYDVLHTNNRQNNNHISLTINIL